MEKFKQISPQEHIFLKRLCLLENKPQTLYYYGKLPDAGAAGGRFSFEAGRPLSVAIVGARRATEYGLSTAFSLAKQLAELGIVIVSGLAAGVDAASHRGALAGGGVTVGVLGTPVDQPYPAENIPLMEEILARRGAILSEYPPGFKKTQSGMNMFLFRNRLIAGLSDAVVVTEAAERSGSINTAHHALNAGVPVFVVPGDVGRKRSAGCNRLIYDGANPCLSVSDVLAAIGYRRL